MLAYHGTTQACARAILGEGFLPKPPSRRVWFAESRGYAMGRAKTQARRTDEVPVVLACDLDLDELRRRLGAKRVVCKKGIIAVDGSVPVEMLRSYRFADMATVPEEVTAWISSLLHLEPDQSVKADHPGLLRLSRWINARIASKPESKLLSSELLQKAKRWLPEYFVGSNLGLEDLRAHRRVGLTDYEVDPPACEPDPREAEAIDCLDDPRAAQRIRGLSLLAEIRDPALFDWCAMCTDDEAVTVQIAAFRTMLECEDGVTEPIAPFAASEDRRVRAVAIAALARHAGNDASRWIKRGLEDPEICVRVAAVRFLGQLDPRRQRSIFELAKNDPSPEVCGRARKLALAKRRRKKTG